VSTREQGVSQAPYDCGNVGIHVGDTQEAVAENRLRLQKVASMPTAPIWVEQVHGNGVWVHNGHDVAEMPVADAVYSRQAGAVCLIQTADCVPILLCNEAGTEVAAVHAGWRGLANGVLAATLAHFQAPGSAILAWIGPTICQKCYEVDAGLRERFAALDQAYLAAFAPGRDAEHFQADLLAITHMQLKSAQLTRIYQAPHCTSEHSNLFYSARREQRTGRMASFIWFE
jgi:hypothetical protein